MLRGGDAADVALQLGLCLHTVNSYIKEVYRRLHVRDRIELLAQWWRSPAHPAHLMPPEFFGVSRRSGPPTTP